MQKCVDISEGSESEIYINSNSESANSEDNNSEMSITKQRKPSTTNRKMVNKTRYQKMVNKTRFQKKTKKKRKKKGKLKANANWQKVLCIMLKLAKTMDGFFN